MIGDDRLAEVKAGSDGLATVTAGGYTAQGSVGLSVSVPVTGSDGQPCQLVYTGGLLTGTSCN